MLQRDKIEIVKANEGEHYSYHAQLVITSHKKIDKLVHNNEVEKDVKLWLKEAIMFQAYQEIFQDLCNLRRDVMHDINPTADVDLIAKKFKTLLEKVRKV